MSHPTDRPGLVQRLAIAALAYLAALGLAVVVNSPTAAGQVRPAGYFPR